LIVQRHKIEGLVQRHELDGLCVLLVRARTKAGSDWIDGNRHQTIQKTDPVLSVCHAGALPKLIGARRDGLVVVVEGEDR